MVLVSCGDDDGEQKAAVVFTQILHGIQEAVGELLPCAGILDLDARNQLEIEFNDSGP